MYGGAALDIFKVLEGAFTPRKKLGAQNAQCAFTHRNIYTMGASLFDQTPPPMHAVLVT